MSEQQQGEPPIPPAESCIGTPLQEIPGVVKDLAQAFSSHAKATNRSWLTLMGVALFVLVRLPGVSSGPAPTIDLPWSLGSVRAVHFYVVSALVLSVLSIALCSAHAQMARSYKLTLEAADAFCEARHVGPFHIRDVLEALMTSHLLRLAPLANLVRGDRRFFHEKEVSHPTAILSGVYYLALKVLGAIVYLLFPGAALFAVWHTYEGNDAARLAIGWLPYVVRLFVAFAALAFILTLWNEARHAIRSFKAILRRRPLRSIGAENPRTPRTPSEGTPGETA